jgi:hypothetical protein
LAVTLIMRAAMTLTLADLKTIVVIVDASHYRKLNLEAGDARLSIDGDDRQSQGPGSGSAPKTRTETP